jgi:hypothetical protein
MEVGWQTLARKRPRPTEQELLSLSLLVVALAEAAIRTTVLR